MRNDVTVMQIDEALQYVAHQGRDKHLIQIQIIVGQNIFETASCTVRRQNGHLILIDRGTDKGNYVLVMDLV